MVALAPEGSPAIGGTIKPMIRLAAIYRTLDLTGDPFALDPLSGTVAPLGTFEDGRAALLAWLQQRGESPSLGLITGSAGSGRTMLLAEVASGLTADPSITLHPVVLDDGKQTDVRLLRAIIHALGGEPAGRTGLELVNETRVLVANSIRAGNRPVIVLDDAELGGSRLEILRSLLTPPEDAPAGYELRIILTGERDLRDRLARRRTLAYQIGCTVDLAPLDGDEVAVLVRSRIEGMREGREPVAEDASPRFADDALAIVGEWSGGNPGAVIRLAGECLLEAIARGKRDVDAEIAHDVARELTDRARQVARAEAAAPYVLPAVQTKLALTLADDVPVISTSQAVPAPLPAPLPAPGRTSRSRRPERSVR